MLEHHPNVGAKLGKVGFAVIHFGAVNDNLALLDRFQPINGFDKRRLTGAGRAASVST
ncbi:Uncharacterised protein [Enterobacter cloacae]|nr:Uncharacterised protein [Enterobacter cloacae]